VANHKHNSSERPIKPYPDFPLFPHSTGRWAKKIKGKLHYFGPWDDPDGAYRRYLARKEELATADSKPEEVATRATGQRLDRPAKPWPGFPLYPHGSGQWAKKIRGETHYFGADADEAFKLYQQQKDDLEVGRTPKPPAGYRLTIKDMVNLCLMVKEAKVESGELDRRTYKEYQRCGRRLMRVLGRGTFVEDLGPSDFLKLRRDMAKTLTSLTSIKGDIRKLMVFFNFAYNEGHIERPVKPGEAFRTPAAAALRREREGKPKKLFGAEQIRAMLAKANPQMKAMVLLGINCAFGNTDCVLLTKNRIDLKGGWIRYPRPKTGVPRHCPLWPETIVALKVVLSQEESKHPEYKNRVFVVDKRKPVANHIDDGRRVSLYFRALLSSIGIPEDSPNFYALRHTFVTVAMQPRDKDKEAIRTITGHGPNGRDMLDEYNEEDVANARLLAVSNYVHDWLFRTESPLSGADTGEHVVSTGQRVEPLTSLPDPPETQQEPPG
jgi:integrase